MRRVLVVLTVLGLAIGTGLVAGLLALLRRATRRSRRDPARPATAGPSGGRLLLVALPALGLAGFVFFITVGAPWLLLRQPYPAPPQQPIAFDHQVHVGLAGLDCAFCHRTASQSATAGYPDLQQCMFCHLVVDSGTSSSAAAAQIERVQNAWVAQRPIDWVRLHRVPDHSRFPHDAHVQAGVACATCHGDVGRMGQVVQVRSLKMGDCVACHRESNATAGCGACHY